MQFIVASASHANGFFRSAETMQRKRQDPTTNASLKNVRQQQKLETKFEEIDKLWDKQLKSFTKRRLDCTYDLTNYRENVKGFEHLPSNISLPDLKDLTMQTRMKYHEDKKEKMNKYALKQPDPVDRMPIPQLPLDVQEAIERDYRKMLESQNPKKIFTQKNEEEAANESGASSQQGSASSSRRSSGTPQTSLIPLMPKLYKRRQTIAVPNSVNLEGKPFARPCDVQHQHKKLPPVKFRRGSVS